MSEPGGNVPQSNTNERQRDTDRGAASLAPVSRSIIIGLGGTGHQVLLDVRRRIIDKYGSLNNVPFVNFLEIDTDEDVQRDQIMRDDDPPEANLQMAEKLWANIGDVQNLEDNLQQYPYIANWLDRNALLRGKDVQHGAGAIRARGRLALFRNYDDLQRRLETTYKRISDPRVLEECQRMGLKVSQSISVYIVGSLLGGTCSGMFLDMAYIAGRVIPGNPDVIGILSIPPVAGGRQDHRANAYAALLELNHYCYPHTQFTAQYTPTQPELRNRREPFTYCYLVGMNNGQQQLSSVQDQVSLIGHSVFLDLTSEFQAQKRSNRDNFQQFLIHSDRIGSPQSYMSFGLSSIHFPKDKVISACGFRLAGETIDSWLKAPSVNEELLRRFVTDRLSELKLLPGDVNLWLRMTQDGTTLDSAIDGWRENLNDELSRTKPPASALANTISQHDYTMQNQNLRDAEPNADILAKSRDNLGLYLRQIQGNFLSALRERTPHDLEAWIERMVDDPHRRPAIARAALLQARELFVQAANGLDAAVQSHIAPAEPYHDQAKNAALQKLHADAGSVLLKLVPGAYGETLNADRENALAACAAFYKARVDAVVARHAARFFHELPPMVDRMIAELDAYTVKLEGIRNDFRAKEQETVNSPVFVNGERLWDRDHDIDTFYTRYATDERKGNVSASAVSALANDGANGGRLYSLRKLDDAAIRRPILQHAQAVFAPLQDDVDVLSRFFQKYPETARRLEAVRHVYRLSQPFVDLKPAFFQSADDFVALEGKRQTVVGVHNGSQPGSPQETEFRNLLNQVERLAPERFAALNNSYETLFLRESAAFPLRLLREVDAYKQDYEFMATQGATQNPLHTRKDVPRWEPIYVPGSYQQDSAWETFAVGWGSGVIQDGMDRVGRTTFTTSFRDEFGMPVDRTVGALLPVEKSLEREADRPADSDTPANPLPPLEVRDIILTLCQDGPLMEGIRRSIESRIIHLGGEQFATLLATHAEEQKSRELSFYEAYRQRLIRFMNSRAFRPGASAEGQPARIEIIPADGVVRPDRVLALQARVFDSLARELTNIPITWSSRPNDIGVIDAHGAFRAMRVGEATVTAAAGPITATAHVRVDPMAEDAVTLPSPTAPLALEPLDGDATLRPAGLPGSLNLPDAATNANGNGSVGTGDLGVSPVSAAAKPSPAPSSAAPLASRAVSTTPPATTCICGAAIEPGFQICPECGKPLLCRNGHTVKPSWKKCPYCGDDLSPIAAQPKVEQRHCSSCGSELEPDFQLCPECGEPAPASV